MVGLKDVGGGRDGVGQVGDGKINHEDTVRSIAMSPRSIKYELRQAYLDDLTCRHLTGIEANFRPMLPIWCYRWGPLSQP